MVLIGGVALAALGIFVAVHLLEAARAGSRGRAALTLAEADLSARRLAEGRTNLEAAEAAFARMA